MFAGIPVLNLAPMWRPTAELAAAGGNGGINPRRWRNEPSVAVPTG
jgi:hypothetical protein